MRRICLFAAVAVLPLAAAGGAFAQEPADVEQVVVTSGPLPTSLDSATTHVEILNRGQLDMAPPAGLGDTLANLPGLRSTAFGPGSSRPVIRGLSGPRVMILQNGVGMIDASSLSPDHAVASDPSEASKIEVLRGPSTLAYGGSGIGGVVNVLDERVPSAVAANGVEGRLATSYGTVDNGRSIAGGLKAGKGPIVVSADASARRSDDYSVPTPFGNVDVPNSDVKMDAYGVGASYVHAQGFFGASIKQTKTEYGVPYADARITGSAPEGGEGPVGIDLKQTRVDVRGEQELDLGPFNRARLSLGYADYRHREIERATGDIGTTFLSDGFEGRLEIIEREQNGQQGAIGFQGLTRKIEAIGDEAFIPSTRVSELGAFTLQRLDRDIWGLEGGLRVDRRDLKTPDESRDFTNVSASAGVFVRPSQPWFLALSLSHNRRSPTEVELFADGPHPGTNAFEIGDANLKPESVNSVEATIRWSNDVFRAETHLYAARYSDFIDELPTGEIEDDLPVYTYVQTDAKFIGAEAEAAWTFWREGARQWRLEAATDWVRGSTDLGPPARIPPLSVTGRLVYESRRVGGEAEVRHVASQDRTAQLETPTDGYTLVNATAWVKPWSDRSVRLFAEARNIGNAEAREHVSFLKDIAPMAGRSFRLGLSAQF